MLAECRQLSTRDAPAVAELEEASFKEPWSLAMVNAELGSPTALGIGAFDDAEDLVGYALFRLAKPTADLNRIAVHQRARRAGIGGRLLDHAHQLLVELRAAECFLEVRHTNTAAIDLYLKNDYVVVGKRQRYYSDGTDALLMRRQLT